MTDPPADAKSGPKQESPPPHGGDPAATASHAPVTSPSSYTSSPGSSPSGTPSTKSLPEETPPPAPEPRERRKRSRVSPEQLIVLEAIFAADRCPTAVRRKEISEQLGMNERQTQIWFQNRRAKAKQADSGKVLSKAKQSSSSPTSPAAPSPLHQIPRYPSQDLDLQKRIHEDDPVIVIPCTELSIGSWTRMASDKKGKQHDLLAYVCEARRRLTWYVHYHEDDVEHSVKMDISFDSVSDIKLTQATADTAQASLYLSQPPAFYMEVRSPDASRIWMLCGDWTANQQATQIMRHELCGAYAPLTYLWKRIHSERRVSRPSAFRAHAPTPSIAIPPPPAHDFLSPPHAFSHGFIGQQQQQQQQAMFGGFGSYPPATYSRLQHTGLATAPLESLSPVLGLRGGSSGSPSFAYAYTSRLSEPMPLQPWRGFGSAGAHGQTHAQFLGEPPPPNNRRLSSPGGEGEQQVVAPVPETPIDIGAFWMNVG
ncbi:hypothetical protein PHLGIDRAFT_10905 [Phlebiopsis gigantea 11061_1 CR5-6]|uniref:Homeobox domain-containing protein n=1 Tax=Phlebiopsis gigantea (strain 11061_1 CR5-6) TaxID=745531 RepID=A0A0C3SEV6_PHLG1|nr:hypothetical protein PHLGIDRAFT_10905 [Phlebiopsis gigantea 11061_1 CR5-6]